MSYLTQFDISGVIIPIQTLTGDVGGAISPIAGNINLLGGNVLTTTGAGNTITFDLDNGTDGQVLIGGGADPLWATITSAGATIAFTPGANTLNMEVAGIVASSFPTDVGTAIPAAGALTITGGTGINTAGAAAVVTINLDIPVLVANGGTGATTLTDHGIMLGSGAAAVTVLGAATNGQLPIGSTGLDPVLGNITSPEDLTITNGAGIISIDFSPNAHETAINSWNGALLETAAVSATSDGVTITFSVELNGGGDLTAVFSDGFYDWDTTPADTVTLTAGADIAPQINFVYLLQSTKTLTASTVGWPAAEHAPLATVLCQSAASLQTDGAYKLHAWTDHVIQSNDQGHLSDINLWIRSQNASYSSGVSQTLTITPNGGAPDNVIFTSSAGIVLQLHPHTFPAFGGTPDIYTINDSVTPYNIVTDLNALLTDSTGASLSGRFFSLVIWGVVNESTGDCKLMVNLPGGSYGNSSQVTADDSKYANYTIPSDFTGTGFLIAQYNLRHQVAAGGTWTEIGFFDLRGSVPSIGAGSATSAGTEFVDNVFRIIDEGDNTKEIAFQASGITTATVRTLTVQDADGIIALSGVANYGTGVTSNTAYAVLCGGTTSTNPIQSIASVGTAAQILTSNGAAALPTFQDAPASGIAWNEETGTSATMAVDNGYIANNAGLVTLTLPTTAALGSIIRVTGKGAGGWKIAQNASEVIHFGTSDTTTGAGGSLASTETYDSIELVCTVADTAWTVLSSIGNITVV